MNNQIADNNVFIDACSKNRDLFKSIACSYVKNDAMAEDIVQDAIVKVFVITKSTPIDNAKAYLITAVRNRALNYLSSSEKKKMVHIDDVIYQNACISEPSQSMVLEGQEKFRLFEESLNSLPPQCRKVLLLKKIDGLSLKETADKLNITTSTVQKHLTKALARCVIYMAEHGY